MGSKRVYEVAQAYGKSVNEVLELLKKHNIEKTNFSGVDENTMAVIKNAYDKKPAPPKPAKAEHKEQPKQVHPVKVERKEQPKQQEAKRQDNKTAGNSQKNMQQQNQQKRNENRGENRQGGNNNNKIGRAHV